MESREPSGKTVAELTRALRAAVGQRWGAAAFRISTLAGDASSRIYHRLSEEGERHRSMVVMELGPDPLGSDEIAEGERPQELPFYEVQRFLARGGIAVPQIHAYLRDEGLLLLEDLGDETFGSRVLPADEHTRRELYGQALDLLVAMQRHAAASNEACVCFERRFDYRLLRWELDHFREWLLEADRGVELARDERTKLDAVFDALAKQLEAMPTAWVHRDYQSRNLMVQRDGNEELKLRVIDFQDALVGPMVYDLVGLLRDSYVDLGVPLVERLLDDYRKRMPISVDADTLRERFWLQTVQRKLKDAGRFVYIDRVRGNPGFLQYIPTSLRYVREALARLPQLSELRALLGRHLPELRG